MLELVTTRLEDAANWGRKFSFFTYPFVTACCGMEFMSVAAPEEPPMAVSMKSPL